MVIEIILNGTRSEVRDGSTIATLVSGLGGDGPRAVAHNGEVVPRSAWNDILVTEGDIVEVLAAAAGG